MKPQFTFFFSSIGRERIETSEKASGEEIQEQVKKCYLSSPFFSHFLFFL